MTQIAKLTANVLAGASDQVLAHGLDYTPDLIFIVEKNELTGAKAGLLAQCFTKVGSAIGTTKTTIQIAAAAAFTVAGVHYAKAITDDFFVLTGFGVTNAMYNVCLLCIDTAGAMQIGIGTEAATLAAVVLAATPANSCVVAQVVVNPTGTGNFVGGTTDLDDATVVPGAVYSDLGGHPDLYGEVTLGSAADATNIYLDNNAEFARAVQVIAFALHSIIA